MKPLSEPKAAGDNGSALHGLENPSDRGGWFVAHSKPRSLP
jgi:hypothetical protein